MDRLGNSWQVFRLSPGKWILALFEVVLLVGERCFEVATLVQYAQNGDGWWFFWTMYILYLVPLAFLLLVIFCILLRYNVVCEHRKAKPYT